ncbi:hypothetical protein NX794_07555 [Streptomyces sp. LP11]|uniref:Uncharacterized protein n=1 Tax=Streptomyces pyxinicus TaxID=2970331 RepID=A0ABT2AXW4_9ACTN|nr:hypothetical protein [Streptomyces sp. LP11]MCS0601086.1 hypothetical protein [Streptomyces sp. LP11]
MLRVLEQANLVADEGRIRVYIDAEEEDFRLVTDADGHDTKIMKDLLDFLEVFGLELVDDFEYDPEFDDEGNVVMYLCETDPKDVSA